MTLKAFWLQSAAAAAFAAGAAISGPALSNPIPPAATYADLLAPVPDAAARLAADDAMSPPVAHLELAKYQMADHHHHHHHHHHSWRWYRDNGYYWTGQTWVMIPNYNHHHHARQWYNDNGYYWNGRAWMLRKDHHHHHHHHHQGT